MGGERIAGRVDREIGPGRGCFAPMVAVQPIGVGSQQRTLLWQSRSGSCGWICDGQLSGDLPGYRTSGLPPALDGCRLTATGCSDATRMQYRREPTSGSVV